MLLLTIQAWSRAKFKKNYFIQGKFLKPNTAPIIQPIDRQVIPNVKKMYAKGQFQKCFEIANDTK